MSLASILKAAVPFLPSIVGTIGSYKTSQPTNAERQAEQYYAAAGDPNSPLMQQYTQSENASLNRDFATRIQELVNQNRRQTRMGRTPLFDPETADQSLWRAGALYGAESGDKARQNARNNLLGMAQNYSSMIPHQQERTQKQWEANTGLAQSGSDLLGLLLQKYL